MKQRIYLLAVLFIGLFTGCEDIVEVDLGDETAVLYAVEAKITTEDNPYVYLYRSQRVDHDEPYTGISGAHVIVFEDGQPANSVTLTESTERQGFYSVPESINFKGEENKRYTVEIEVDDVVLTATDTLAQVEPIDSIQVRPSLRGDKLFLGIFTYGDEPVGEGDYYKWDVFITDNFLNEATYLMIASDELVDGNYVNGFEVFTDFHDPNKPEERKITLGDTVQVKQTSISEFAYYYYFQMLNQSQTGSLFSVPPANIKGNFTASDGSTVLGLFTAHDISASNKIVIDEEIENQLED